MFRSILTCLAHLNERQIRNHTTDLICSAVCYLTRLAQVKPSYRLATRLPTYSHTRTRTHTHTYPRAYLYVYPPPAPTPAPYLGTLVDRNPFLGWIRSTPAVSDHRPGLSRTHTHKHTYKHTHLPSTFATTPFGGANPVPKQRAEVRRTSGQPASSSGPGQPRSASRVRFLMNGSCSAHNTRRLHRGPFEGVGGTLT